MKVYLKKSEMKRNFTIAILITIVFLALLWLEKPMRMYLLSLDFPAIPAKQIPRIFVRINLIMLAFLFIRKFDLLRFSGIKPWRKFENLHALIIPMVIIAFGVKSNFEIYSQSDWFYLILFIISVLSVGLVEELVFRGIAFPLFIRSFAKNLRPILKSAILSSLLFGVIHFVNLFSQPDNFVGILSQVFFALSIGVFFAGLLVRTKNILIPATIHAFINFGFGAGELKSQIRETVSTAIPQVTNWDSIIPTALFFVFVLGGGIYMLSMADKEVVLRDAAELSS